MVRRFPDATPAPPSFVIIFFCHHCGTRLSINADQMGQVGPCPTCQTLLTAPVVEISPPVPPPQRTHEDQPVPPFDPNRSKVSHAPAQSRRKGMILPDSNIDRRELERREMWAVFRVVSLLIVVVCTCMAILWYMKHWAAK